MYVAVQHSVSDDCGASSTSRLKGHGGADFYAIDAFVYAVLVCIVFSTWSVDNPLKCL